MINFIVIVIVLALILIFIGNKKKEMEKTIESEIVELQRRYSSSLEDEIGIIFSVHENLSKNKLGLPTIIIDEVRVNFIRTLNCCIFLNQAGSNKINPSDVYKALNIKPLSGSAVGVREAIEFHEENFIG